MKSSIGIKTRFAGTHRYPAAPDEVAFLRVDHRHEFHVEAWIEVNHDDRELEFFMVKRALDEELLNWPFDLGTTSCEMMAKNIIVFFQSKYGKRNYAVIVSEDGENAALVVS